MTKGRPWVWSLLRLLEPDFYGYSFAVDGVSGLNPSTLLKTNLLNKSIGACSRPSSLPWDERHSTREVPRHFYHSHGGRSPRLLCLYPAGLHAKDKKK